MAVVVTGKNGTRTTDDPGQATVIGGEGRPADLPFDWGNLAYTAGGGALGYMLSKWLMGDDEDEKDKKKGKGILKSLVPWLSAAAGAYGGHLLSGASSGEPGQRGEFAFFKNEDGTVNIPHKPKSGGGHHRFANKSLAVSAGTGFRALANYFENLPDRLRGKAKRIKANGVVRSNVTNLIESYKDRAAMIEAKRATRSKALEIPRKLVGGNIPGPRWWKTLTGWKGNLIASIASAALGIGAHIAGHEMNAERREWVKARNQLLGIKQ